MDKIILGLLILKSMTIYDIKKFVATYLSHSYADSLGSIQYALKKLLGANAIEFVAYVENGHNKKEYTITKLGMKMFKEWLEQPVNSRSSQKIDERKLFFLGLTEKKVRKKVLQGYIESLKQEKEQYQTIQKMVTEGTNDPIQEAFEQLKSDDLVKTRLESLLGDRTLYNGVEDIYHYQMSTLRLSLLEIDAQIHLYEELLEHEKNRAFD